MGHICEPGKLRQDMRIFNRDVRMPLAVPQREISLPVSAVTVDSCEFFRDGDEYPSEFWKIWHLSLIEKN